jgi:membrane fusion protein (multidrug efflux system)
MYTNENKQTIYADEKQTYTRIEHDTERSKSNSATVAASGRSRLGRKRMLLASIALVIGIVSAWFLHNSVLYESTDDAQVDGRILPLNSRINGTVQQVNVVDGQFVHAGDVVAVLDQTAYSIAVFEARANLAYAQYSAARLYLNAAITTTTVYGGLYEAEAEVRNASVEVETAEHKLRADEALLKRAQIDGSVAEAVATSDQGVLLQAQDKLAEAIRNLKTAQTAPQQVSLAKVEAQAADSQVLQRKAELERAQLNLGYTIIRSQVDGIVGKRRVEIGQNVNAGQELIDVVLLDDVWITANFRETQLGHLRPGQPVDIKVDAYGRTWKGHVTSLGGGTGSVFSTMPFKNASGNRMEVVQRVPVRIDFDRSQDQTFNAEGLLKPGLSVEPDVRVRLLPRSNTPNTLPGSRDQLRDQ